MSYDIDEEGNKTFYEQELINDEDKMYSFIIHYSGKVYVEARDENEAYDKFLQEGDFEPDDVDVVRE
jgi:hypothetical protein